MKIAIYDPGVLLWGVATSFHGYAVEFLIQYADYIYVKLNSPGAFIRMYHYKQKMKELGIGRQVKFVHSMQELNRKSDVLVGFSIPPAAAAADVRKFSGKKFFHLMDYYLFPKENNDFLEKSRVDYVMGHCQMDTHSKLFQKYYPQYVGRTLSVPFGYGERFVCTVPFEERIMKAVGLGSINPMHDPLIPDEATVAIRLFFPEVGYMHPTRKYLQDHAEEYVDCIDALFPTPEKQKDFSYDAVQMLNSYAMFINDAGISNFPPARTYEGIAAGSVMVAADNPIYSELGFEPGVNYIAFEEGNYKDLGDKVRYYIAHPEELHEIQKRSLNLAEQYPHKKVAKMMYQLIEERIKES